MEITPAAFFCHCGLGWPFGSRACFSTLCGVGQLPLPTSRSLVDWRLGKLWVRSRPDRHALQASPTRVVVIQYLLYRHGLFYRHVHVQCPSHGAGTSNSIGTKESALSLLRRPLALRMVLRRSAATLTSKLCHGRIFSIFSKQMALMRSTNEHPRSSAISGALLRPRPRHG